LPQKPSALFHVGLPQLPYLQKHFVSALSAFMGVGISAPPPPAASLSFSRQYLLQKPGFPSQVGLSQLADWQKTLSAPGTITDFLQDLEQYSPAKPFHAGLPQPGVGQPIASAIAARPAKIKEGGSDRV
jgi:hypothetical protein